MNSRQISALEVPGVASAGLRKSISPRPLTSNPVGIVTSGELIKCNFTPYPNVQRWIAKLKKLPNWDKINEVCYGFAGSVKDRTFNAL